MTAQWVRHLWNRDGVAWRLLGLALLPFALAYRTAVQARNLTYAAGWRKGMRLDRPVISVGNLTVGGTGKTPACIWLARELERRGYRVGVLSRGYRRKSREVVVLSGGGRPPAGADGAAEVDLAGDEPAMMARLHGCRVAVGADRYESARVLLAREPVDVFILDDGFQHRRLARDVDVLLLGSDTDGRLLPVGPFREPVGSLRRADYYLVTGGAQRWKRRLPSGEERRWFEARLQPRALIAGDGQGWKEFPLSLLYRSKIVAVSGIGNPEGFYRTIQEWEGEIVEAVEFEDHHAYSAADWQRINRLARNCDLIVTTEKDLLKLLRFPFARYQLLALRMALAVDEGERLVQAIVDRIGRRGEAS
ncbi:MAG TPA: tetraacyldisaccharide 4'-kinase [candidate division Zixibacteria bacterium]|nr:tetraacyldisaccharide 4'-kinase [candidate division Zixibacteria bacterium]